MRTRRAIGAGRLGRILQADAYVKWFRPEAYYARPVKGSWAVEGGGALINQAIHQVDLLLWLAGSIRRATGEWQLGAAHAIESEDVVSAVLRYESGATGVIQAATAFQPGYPERLEFHGTRGSAIITGDVLTRWDVENDTGEAPPLARAAASGASEPMAISLAPFERQFRDFAAAISSGSFLTDGMLVIPCSMKSASGIAYSMNSNLLVRAADVCLKEKRRLVLVVRETPLHLGHLRTLAALAEIGAVILPPVPAMYANPQSVDDIIAHTVGKALDQFGIANELFKRWRS